MGHHQTVLQYGVTFEEPSEQLWTFGSGEVIETMHQVLLIENGMDEKSVHAMEYGALEKDLRLEHHLKERLGLEIPWVNQPTNLGDRFLLIASKEVSVEEGCAKQIPADHFVFGLEEVLRLEWAVKTLELKASAPSWMLQSVYY